MKISHNQLSIEVLGDPHLGRTFVHGVPLARRGEREATVWKDFEHSLMHGNHDIHICMGDLFDKWSVPYDVVYRAATLYKRAAEALSGCRFYILRGNHDISLDLERHGAFDVFAQIMEGIRNVVVIEHATAVRIDEDEEALGLFPWHPTEYAENLILFPCGMAFGHWDTEFGKANMIPTQRMAEWGIKQAYTGHVHKPETFVRDGVDVTVVGSMQPYAHGEQVNDDLYVTLTLDQLDGFDTTNRCVRVLLQQGEVLDRQIDCLQLVVKREGTTDLPEEEVSLGNFDINALFEQAFNQENVPASVRERVLGRYHEAA